MKGRNRVKLLTWPSWEKLRIKFSLQLFDIVNCTNPGEQTREADYFKKDLK